jgi:hypothetical protein
VVKAVGEELVIRENAIENGHHLAVQKFVREQVAAKATAAN